MSLQPKLHTPNALVNIVIHAHFLGSFADCDAVELAKLNPFVLQKRPAQHGRDKICLHSAQWHQGTIPFYVSGLLSFSGGQDSHLRYYIS